MSKQDTNSSASNDSTRSGSRSVPDTTTQPLGSLVDSLPSGGDPTAALPPDGATAQTDAEDTSDWNRFGAHVMPPGLREQLIRTKLPRVPQEQLFDTVPPERVRALDSAANQTSNSPRPELSAPVPLPETAHQRSDDTQPARRINAQRPSGQATPRTARPTAESPAAKRRLLTRPILFVAVGALLMGLVVWAVTHSLGQPASRSDVTVAVPHETGAAATHTAAQPPEKHTPEAPPVNPSTSSPPAVQQSPPPIELPKLEAHDRTRSKPPRAPTKRAAAPSSQAPTPPLGQSAEPSVTPPPPVPGSPLDAKGLPRLE